MSDRFPLRPEVSQATREEAVMELLTNLKRRLDQHGALGFAGKAEGLGVITEEYHELVDAVRSNDLAEVRKEACDVAVGCLWLMATIREKEKEPR